MYVTPEPLPHLKLGPRRHRPQTRRRRRDDRPGDHPQTDVRWPVGAPAEPVRVRPFDVNETLSDRAQHTPWRPWPVRDRLADTRACLPAESSPRIRVCGAPFRIPQQTIQQMWSEIRGVTSFRRARRTSFQQRLQPKHGGDEV